MTKERTSIQQGILRWRHRMLLKWRQLVFMKLSQTNEQHHEELNAYVMLGCIDLRSINLHTVGLFFNVYDHLFKSLLLIKMPCNREWSIFISSELIASKFAKIKTTSVCSDRNEFTVYCCYGLILASYLCYQLHANEQQEKKSSKFAWCSHE